PIWRLLPVETAFHGVQLENAFVASLTAIPVYLLARWLGLRPLYSYACAAYSLAIPSLVLVAMTLSDPVAYPLVLAAVAAGVRADPAAAAPLLRVCEPRHAHARPVRGARAGVPRRCGVGGRPRVPEASPARADRHGSRDRGRPRRRAWVLLGHRELSAERR